ncbi:unnamed protein product [Adineta steineri]|uniref:Ankyrin repeat protein n=1 Tax=Adineta steineri TaxID=433720 RepID=A0A814K2T8_9BILA|nr:unnamed protein product [Adineta steineri]CAF1053550.1 unnamed protein product [Adineta steineri]CAF1120756.1 unnamed protein product [Adineta steineri]
MIKLFIESRYDATPLHVATDRNRLDIVKYLIEEAHGGVHKLLQQTDTGINHQNIYGETTLHYAAIHDQNDAI